MPVILLGGGNVAVSVARSLGERGTEVHALGDAEWDTVGQSRHCASFVHVGHEQLQERYLEWLSVCRLGEAVVFPCDDESLELVARSRRELQELGYRPIEANDEVLLAMLDKERSYRLAEQAGVGVPRRFVLESPADIDAHLEASGVGFPCALKPLYSHLFARRFGASAKVILLPDRAELERVAGDLSSLGSKMMVTEIIAGPENAYVSLYTYLDERGEPLMQFTKRKLRQYPTGFGIGTYHVSTLDPEVARVGLQFCQGVKLRGVACVEFKKDARDGRLKLIECNHRFTLAGELLRHSGVNLPVLAYSRLTGGPAPSMSAYRSGVRLWVPRTDAKAFREYRRRHELTAAQWIRSLLHPQHFPAFDASDPGPSLASGWRAARRLARKAATRLRG
jgi:D-aspartate ligase